VKQLALMTEPETERQFYFRLAHKWARKARRHVPGAGRVCLAMLKQALRA
jgi:hypothetical protein